MKTYKFQVVFNRDDGSVIISNRPDNILSIAFVKDEIGTDRWNVNVTVVDELR